MLNRESPTDISAKKRWDLREANFVDDGHLQRGELVAPVVYVIMSLYHLQRGELAAPVVYVCIVCVHVMFSCIVYVCIVRVCFMLSCIHTCMCTYLCQCV